MLQIGGGGQLLTVMVFVRGRGPKLGRDHGGRNNSLSRHGKLTPLAPDFRK